MALADGGRLEIDFQLASIGAVAGVATDENGKPLPGASARASVRTWSSGFPMDREVGTATTDVRGAYRIGNLYPGDYRLCASTRATLPLNEAQQRRAGIDQMRLGDAMDRTPRRPGQAEAFAARIAELQAKLPAEIEPVLGYGLTCFPGTSSARGTIALGPGEERLGIDLHFVPTLLARVQGVVTGTPDAPVEPSFIGLWPFDDGLNPLESTQPDREGRFLFPTVPPGRYQWSGRAPSGLRSGPKGRELAPRWPAAKSSSRVATWTASCCKCSGRPPFPGGSSSTGIPRRRQTCCRRCTPGSNPCR